MALRLFRAIAVATTLAVGAVGGKSTCERLDGATAIFADMHDGDQKAVEISGDTLTIKPHGNDETWEVVSALDLAPTGKGELPAGLLPLFFRRVLSARSLDPAEEHLFQHALLGQAHRHMLHMSVYATPLLAQRRLYSSMGRLLAHTFTRGSGEAPASDALLAPPSCGAGSPSGAAGGRDGAAGCALPPVSTLLAWFPR